MRVKNIRILASVLCLAVLFTSLFTACGTKVKVGDFYVKYAATGDGLSPENPAGSVNAVKAEINKSLGENDIANVWIMQDNSDGFDVWAFAKGDGKEKTSQFTVWKKSDEKAISHTATMVVQTYIPEGKKAENTASAYLAFSEKIGKNSVLTLTGPTEFKNIKLVPTAKTDRLDMAGNSVVFGENIVYRSIDLEDGEDYSDWKDITLTDEATDFTTCLGTEEKAVFENPIDVVFDNRPFNCGEFYLPSNTKTDVQFKEDVTVEYNDAASASFRMIVAADEGEKTDYTAHFYKNLNVKMKQAYAVSIFPGKSSVLIDGAAQFIVDPETTYYIPNDKEYSFKNLENLKKKTDKGEIVDADKYILYINSDEQELIDFVEGTVGKYNIAKGYIAVAVNRKEGSEPIIAKGGKLKLDTAGEYDVSITKNYTNDGETIKVYKRSEIDLSNVRHKDIEGQAFIGWKTEDGKSPEKVQKHQKGTVLKAQYVPIEFCVEETKIEEGSVGLHSLQFVISKGNDFYKALPKPLEYGAIHLPSDTTLGTEMYINEQIVLTWKYDAETGENFEPDRIGRTPTRVKVWNNSIKNPEIDKSVEGVEKYNIIIEEIDPENYYTWYTVRGYVIYEDVNGIQRIAYTKQDVPDFEDNASNYGKDQSCLYKIAKETPTDKRSEIENEIIKYVEVDRKEYYFSYTEISEYISGYTGMGLKDENPDHKLYRLSNNILVRDVIVKTGLGTEKMEICFIADPHFAALSKKDISENLINGISSYRGRSWTRGTNFRDVSLKYMEYASMFEKTVIGGDAVDYLTYGAMDAVAGLLTKKSINGSIKMVLGNHEPAEMSQNDIGGLHNVMSLEERYKLLANNWTNDPVYSSEIMKTKDGKDNIMMIYLDNGGQHAYNATQLEKFKADIKAAREKKLPVLIFQHIPLAVSAAGSTDMDMKDSATLALDTEIRKSADVVKAIFCGHMHADSVDYLETLKSDGSMGSIKIPQYTVAGAHYNNVMKITVE